ncbi:MAG TPA: hypothetical protein VKS81_09235, partial [Bacteroidota bacterium]|nr:hypothetical protein [Bacteroidota bacterium]
MNFHRSSTIIRLFILIALAFGVIHTGRVWSQSKTPVIEPMDDDESGESVRAREEFFHTRRAGGYGKTIPQGAYERALEQKMELAKRNSTRRVASSAPSWVSATQGGINYGSGYASGRANSIAFDPNNSSIMYLATAGGGVWKTTDAGTTWVPLTDNLTTSTSGSIAIDPHNSNVLYYASGELNYSLDSDFGDGIFKSTNGGTTWTKILLASVSAYFSAVVIDPTNSNIVYAAGEKGVFKSTDAGAHWHTMTNSQYVNSLILNPQNTQTIYITYDATSENFVKKSTDGGNSWTLIGGFLAGRTQLAMAPTDTTMLYATNEAADGGGVYRSTNSGASFTKMNGTTTYMGNGSGNSYSTQAWYDNAVVVSPTDKNTIFVGGTDIWTSSDSGVTLTRKTFYGVPPHPDVHNLTFNNGVLYACTDGGISKSTNNGANWTDLNHTIASLQFEGADYNPTNTQIIYGGMQDNGKGKTTDQGVSFSLVNGGDGGHVVVDPAAPANVYSSYASTHNNPQFLRSNNSGGSWGSFTPSDSSLFYAPFALAPGDHNTMVIGMQSAWITHNAPSAISSDWTQILTHAQSPGLVASIAISATNTNKIYLGFDNGQVLVTTNGGSNWATTNFDDYVSGLMVDPANDNICYASFGGFGLGYPVSLANHVSKTTDGGATWNNITGDLPDVASNAIALRQFSPRMLILATDIGVFTSTNEGTNWTELTQGMPISEVYDVKYNQNAKMILAATHGRGLFTYDLSGDVFSAAPVSLTFPNTHAGSSIKDSIVVSNTGALALPIDSVTSDDSAFTVSPTSGSIPGNSSMTFYVTFAPATYGSHSANITFIDGSLTSPDVVPASGLGVAAIFSANKSRDDLGNILNNTSKTDSIRINNPGNLTLHISSAHVSNAAF